MRNIISLVALFAAVVMIAMVIIPQDAATAEKGNARKGKYFYKKICKECHAKDCKGPELTPMSKTSAQWEAFFKTLDHKFKPMTEIVEEKNIIHIKSFLISHAADSDQPETCG